MSRFPHNSSRRIGRFIVRLVVILLLFSLGSLVYFNVVGVPQFVLRMVQQRLDQSGICFDVDRVKLTVDGWELKNFRYFGSDRNSSSPIFYAETFYVKSTRIAADDSLKGFHVNAEEVSVFSPESLCVGIPAESKLYKVESLEATFGISSKDLVIQEARLQWMDIDLRTQGRVENLDQLAPSSPGQPLLVISAEQYQYIEEWMDAIQLNKTTSVQVDFVLDYARPESNKVNFSLGGKRIKVRDVLFSRIEIVGTSDSSHFSLDRASFDVEEESFEVAGRYEFASGLLQGHVKNEIQQESLYSLVPSHYIQELSRNGIELTGFPIFECSLKSSSIDGLSLELDGRFALSGAQLKDLQLNALAGVVSWNDYRLNVKSFQTQVVGTPNKAEEMGTCMMGGAIKGDAFWDARNHRVQIDADTSCDPYLLLSVLSISDIATNTISDFKFNERPPEVHALVSVSYNDWNTFDLHMQVAAQELSYMGVPLSSLSSSVHYTKGVLDLESVLAKQGIKYLKGSASLDYRKGIASFDGDSTMPPEDVEDLTMPGLNLFGRHINVAGSSEVKARGRIDWRTMRVTDFQAEVQMADMETPAMQFDQLTAAVIGKGPIISVNDAKFSAHSGTGMGSMSVLVNPQGEGIPYKLDIELDALDLGSWLKLIEMDADSSGTGLLYGWLKADADLTKPFFETANGEGRMDVKKGKLADLPLFSGMSKAVRLVFPKFQMLSINRANADFTLKDGVIQSENAYFDGDLLSAKGQGNYSVQEGFDATIQLQLLNDNKVFTLLRFITDPVMGLIELKLEGPFENPSWKLNTLFSGGD